ncbi:conserved hypothetical protein [Verticillium alfalfae VaMs.102]|uniref:5-Methylcytosine G/T mismatch-specific DNA glycosylase n=1 Tax=Verticillium alfalfae (strain VaMs.102 / ATCC MYA-4576 / FGSC 10136) TaxID=526221 RepID=C9SC04_VERA1|nr:conserved hypothetical protein [Verticillium alfalfae VaMs.102]EEY15888.1 conserved hypothetical protein [Verticillium alfalfae VaMs.102]
MSTKDDPEVDLDERPREKKKSKSKRPTSEGDKEHRKSGTRSSRHKKEGGSEISHSHSHSHRRHRTREEKDKDRDKEKERAGSTSELVFEFGRSQNVACSMRSYFGALPRRSARRTARGCQSRRSLGLSSRQAAKRRSAPSRPTIPPPPDPKRKEARPPSPPETDVSGKRRSGTPDTAAKEARKERPSSRLSGISRSASRNEEKSRLSTKSKSSSQATYYKTAAYIPPGVQEGLAADRGPSRSSSKRSVSSKNGRRSDLVDAESSPESAQDSSPKTPTQTPQFPPSMFSAEDKPFTPFQDGEIRPPDTPATDFGGPPPPPPPPAASVQEAPRVDYLLRNGGLPYALPKNFLAVLPRQNGTRPSNPPLTGAQTLFAPFFNLLNQYNTVLEKSGSIAVATGHRSVARRLLDRLENVFSRELPPHGCSCVVCDTGTDLHTGLGWGEVLEWVSGRIDLPQWPPFDLADLGVKAAEMSADLPPRPDSPIKMDPDIAEEFREHYLRQSKKVRGAVDKWLNKCGDNHAPPPQEVDDETLTFAILTNMDPEDRPYFNAILSGSREVQPSLRSPTPMRRPRSDFIIKAGLSLQRLYRLQQAPRDAETASYLIKNPETHDLLVSLSDINTSEWEILTSGRFDGFLWSGADSDDVPTPTGESRGATPASGYFPSRGPTPNLRATPGLPGSRNTTPFSGVYSRGATPASFVSTSTSAQTRQAVSRDEEMELAALAEAEREIYQGMEVLEDAFEALHERAEIVRTALRNRGAGLMLNLQHRRRIDVLPNQPNSGNSQNSGYERPAWATGSELDAVSDSEWGGEDFELMPDDSASNISSSRHRRPKRRTERRTPAPIEEDDEEN